MVCLVMSALQRVGGGEGEGLVDELAKSIDPLSLWWQPNLELDG